MLNQWISGEPPEGAEVAWLHVRWQAMDEEGGREELEKVVLGVKDQVYVGTGYHQELWCEAGDWRGESSKDCVHEDGGVILGWMPYEVPAPPTEQAGARSPALTEEKIVDIGRYWSNARFAAGASRFLVDFARAIEREHGIGVVAPSAQGPAELWLQLNGDCSEAELEEPVDFTGGDVTWCWDKINDSDVRYVRADLTGVQAERERCADLCDTLDHGAFGPPNYLAGIRDGAKGCANAIRRGL